MSDDLWPSLVMSLQIAVLATMLCALVGIPLAFAMAKLRFAGKSLVETLITLPLILPPTVVGYFIVMAAGNQSLVGSWLRSAFDYSLLFSVHGAILSSAIVALPLLYMPTRAAFTSVDRELEDASRQMGANVIQMFWHVSLPLARRGLASGLLLAFARALGEFGATVMVFGTGPGTRPLPIRIYLDYESGDLARATGAVVALTAASLVIMFVYNRSSLARQD